MTWQVPHNGACRYQKKEEWAMSINPVNAAASGVNMSGAGGGENPRIKALEQKLQKLNEEKKKAVEAKDQEKVRKLEEEILKIQKQIEQLKKKDDKKQKEEEEKKTGQEQAGPGRMPEDLSMGKYVDRYA